LSLSAQTSSTPASAAPGKDANRPIPFHGMVAAVDQKNKTFSFSRYYRGSISPCAEREMG
jgi:hypothetical protein